MARDVEVDGRLTPVQDGERGQVSPNRVSHVLRDRVLQTACAETAYRQAMHAVNRARFVAYREEYAAARQRGDGLRMAAILRQVRQLCAASNRLVRENFAMVERLRWRGATGERAVVAADETGHMP